MADVTVHTQPEKLERYAFLWSEARLVIAAIALFLGGVPPVVKLLILLPMLNGLIMPLLTLAWIISGVVSAYLLYRWNLAGKKVFGGSDTRNTVAFFVNIISGFNLGLTGLMGTNIGMRITSNEIVFIIVGILYLASAWHLWQRWKGFGEKMF